MENNRKLKGEKERKHKKLYLKEAKKALKKITE